MDAERWRRVEALFHRAADLAPTERAALLEAECEGDGALRDEVLRLLDSDARPHALVERIEAGALIPEDPLLGREVGVWRLVERLGVGGMGVVYRAERADGLFRHEVAIKLIRMEFASDAVVRRFELERRTLAALQHSHIAQLHGGGTTSEGRPYLVMELVRGRALDRWCDERRLSIDERLSLFVAVCRAVHFAHQNLVIHRDLKPANVLVDGSGAPKLVDFGIAHLIEESAPAASPGLTLSGALALTPDYASPEQLAHGPVTTSMDVYSLGVMLYELLTGRRPFRLEGQSPLAWQREVLERTPTRPSSMVLAPPAAPAAEPSARPSPDELAALRGLSPRALQRALRGDLDRIVLMALRKEPERRYASAKDLADDLERHASGHALLARGDSLAYVTSTFVRRNRMAVGAALAIVVALVAGIVLALHGRDEARAQAAVAREQAGHARIEAESFRAISDYLMETYLSALPGLSAEDRARQRERIAAHAARLRREHALEDHLRANLLDSLGRVAQRLGLHDDAAALLAEALEIRRGAFGEDSLEYALSLQSQGALLYERGEPGAAVDVLREALALHRRHTAQSHTDVAVVANDLGACLRRLGRLDEAEALHREALALRVAQEPGSLEVAESSNNLAGVLLDRGDVAGAASLLEDALAIRRELLGDGHPLTLQSMSNLATACWRLERRAEAHALLDEVEAGLRALRADGEEDLAQVLSNRAGMLIAEGHAKAAAPRLEEALALQRARLGGEHPSVGTTLRRIAEVQQALGRPAEARATWNEALALRRRPGTSPLQLAQTLSQYGVFLADSGDAAAARDAFGEALELLETLGAQQPLELAAAELGLGIALSALGERDAAREHLERVLELARGAPDGMQPIVRRAEEELASEALLAR